MKEPLTSASVTVLNEIGIASTEKLDSNELSLESKQLLIDRQKELQYNELGWTTCELFAHSTLLHVSGIVAIFKL